MNTGTKNCGAEPTGFGVGKRALAVVAAAALLTPNIQPAFAKDASDAGVADAPELNSQVEEGAAKAYKQYRDAQADAAVKQAACNAAAQQAERAQKNLTAATQARDAAKAAADEKAQLAADAQKDYVAKQQACQDADSACASADAAEVAKNKTFAETTAAFNAAQNDLIAKQDALNAANETLKKLQDQKDRGAAEDKSAYDFFAWLGDQQAADILTNAPYASETHLGEENDASCIDNVRCVFQFMDECNAIRESLGLGELRVTSEMMAYAISDCNWSVTTHEHAKQFDVSENLAWWYGKQPYQLNGCSFSISRSNPFYGWYDKEKATYDAAVAGGNYPGLADMSADEVMDTYYNLYTKVGHYLNIVNPAYTVTGFAWSNTDGTFCQVLDASTQAQSYSVGEYKASFEQWCETLAGPDIDSEIEAAQTAAAKAQTEYDEAISAFKKKMADNDTAQTAYNKARYEAKAARAAKEAAEQALTEAQDALSAAQTDSDNAAAAYSAAQQAYEAANAEFSTVQAAYQQKREAYASALADVALAQANYDALKPEQPKKPEQSDQPEQSKQQEAEKRNDGDRQAADQQRTDASDQAKSPAGNAQLAQTGDGAGAHAAAAAGVAAAGALGAIALRRKLKGARHAR